MHDDESLNRTEMGCQPQKGFPPNSFDVCFMMKIEAADIDLNILPAMIYYKKSAIKTFRTVKMQALLPDKS